MKFSWQVLGLTAWCLAVIWVGFELRDLNAPAKRDGDAVGRVFEKSGSVKIKPGNSLIWAEAGRREPVFAGDVVATSDVSKVGIDLLDGRRLTVEQDSMVTIDALDGQDAFNRQLTLDLVQGKVRVANAPVEPPSLLSNLLDAIKPVPPDLALKTADRAYILPSGNATLTVRQPLEGPSSVTGFSGAVTVADVAGQNRPLKQEDVQPAAKVPVKKPGAAVVEAAAPETSVTLAAIDLSPPPKVAVAAKPLTLKTPPPVVVEPLPMSAQLSGARHRVFLTAAPWRCANLGDLPVEIKGAGDGELAEGWRPFIDVRAGQQTERIFGNATADPQQVALPIKDLCLSLGSLPSTLAVELNSGGQAADGKERRAGEASKLTLSSMVVVGEGAVTLFLKQLAAKPLPPHGWLPLSGYDVGQDYPFELRLNDSALMPRLATVFAANGGVVLKVGAPAQDVGIHFVRQGRIVATLSVDRRTSAAQVLAQALDAELAFFGHRSDFVNLPIASLSKVEVVDGLIQSGQSVHLFSRNRLIAVTESDMSDEPGALANLVMTSRVAFKNKVDVIVP